MGQTTIIEDTTDEFTDDGVIEKQSKRIVKKSPVEVTDEFVKVSKYLNTIFAYNNIPLNLVPISLLMAQEMEFKTNIIYLLKPVKEEFAEMLGVSLDRVNKLIKECQHYNIIRPVNRGIYEVNSFLFSTGSIVETRDLQAHFDFDNMTYIANAEQTNLVTGETVRKAVADKNNKKSATKKLKQSTIGQLSFDENMQIKEDTEEQEEQEEQERQDN